MIMSNEKYFNFPITLLNGFLSDKKKCLNRILYYSIYRYSLSHGYGEGDEEKFKESVDYFNVNLYDPKKALKEGKKIYYSINENEPITGISITTYWDYFKNDKTEFQNVCLLAFLALKSILLIKTYCKATNLYMWSRMDGKINKVKDVSELSNEIRKYANRYYTDRIIFELISCWHVVYYSRYTRGFFVSIKLNLDNLIFEAEKRRISTKKKEQKKLQNEALIKAMKRLE